MVVMNTGAYQIMLGKFSSYRVFCLVPVSSGPKMSILEKYSRVHPLFLPCNILVQQSIFFFFFEPKILFLQIISPLPYKHFSKKRYETVCFYFF